MEFRQLRYFVAIAESASFSKAAEKLYITQPALSQQIAKLEEQLGVSLIERNTRSVQLTAAGRDLYRRSILFLGEMENMIQAVIATGSQGFISQSIKVCMEDGLFSMAHTGAYQFLNDIAQQNSALELECFPALAGNIPRILMEGSADLAISFLSSTTSLPPNLCERCFHKGLIALAAPASWRFPFGSPEFHEAFGSATFYFPYDRSYWHGLVTSILADYHCHPRFNSIANYESALNYAAAGCGVFFGPEAQLRGLNNPFIHIIPIPDERTEYRVSALYSQANQSSFLLQLLELLPKEPLSFKSPEGGDSPNA